MKLNCGSGLLKQRTDVGGNERSSALVAAPGFCFLCIPMDVVVVAVAGGWSCVPGHMHAQVEALNSSSHSCSSFPLGKRRGARGKQSADQWVWAVAAEALTCSTEKVKLFV